MNDDEIVEGAKKRAQRRPGAFVGISRSAWPTVRARIRNAAKATRSNVADQATALFIDLLLEADSKSGIVRRSQSWFEQRELAPARWIQRRELLVAAGLLKLLHEERHAHEARAYRIVGWRWLQGYENEPPEEWNA